MAEGLDKISGFFDTTDLPRKLQEFERAVDQSLLRESRRIDALDDAGLQDQIDALDGRVTQNESDIAFLQSSVAFRGTFTNGSGRPFAFTANQSSGGPWTIVGGNNLEVPQTGFYFIAATVKTTSTSTANPRGTNHNLRIGGTTYANQQPYRYSADNTLPFSSTLTLVFRITDPATQRIQVSSSSDGDAILGTQSVLNVTRIGDP